MTNLIAQNDRIEINFSLWTNTPIPAKAWFELLLWPGGYDGFRISAQANTPFEIRHVGKLPIGFCRSDVADARDAGGVR